MAIHQADSDPIKSILDECVKLPSFPDVLLRLSQKLRSEDTDLKDVVQLVGMDPVLSGQILRMANSSWYSRGGKPIIDLSHALIRLGLPATNELVNALVLPSLFPRKDGAFDLQTFWKHSFAVALFSQGIGRRLELDRREMETLWTAGLLHDIGALLFDQVARETYRRLLRIGDRDAMHEDDEPAPVDLSSLEREWLGTDHANLGATFLERYWKLPADIVTSVRHHEDLDRAMHEPATVRTILPIHIADVLCEGRSVSWVPELARKTENLDGAWDLLGFSDSDVSDLSDDAESALEKAEALLLA